MPKEDTAPANAFGLRCPKCGRTDTVDIEMCVWARVVGSSAEPFQSKRFTGWQWENTDPAACALCDHHGVVADFEQPKGTAG
jgi:hypothetical protein